jgi:hypothetical protein
LKSLFLRELLPQIRSCDVFKDNPALYENFYQTSVSKEFAIPFVGDIFVVRTESEDVVRKVNTFLKRHPDFTVFPVLRSDLETTVLDYEI